MRNEKEIMKQNSLSSGIIIKFGFKIAGLALYIGLISRLNISTSAVLGLILCYWGICLAFKLAGCIIRIILSILSILIITSLVILFIF
ncbi:hypothetical protein [Dysgonomonas sp. ZJ709]|uniref:hypothetical protein n=1 Tax=Dysgonomonas sp. ZJ709 TaxID=2709797 RepID=UPI0013ED4D9D|nr:hypothetical protein [Dysgonomonas sp. ZJ709]